MTDSGDTNSSVVVEGVSVLSITSIDSDGVWECCNVVHDDEETTGKSKKKKYKKKGHVNPSHGHRLNRTTQYLLVDGDVRPDDGVIGELNTSTDSDADAELVRPEVFALVVRIAAPLAVVSLFSNVRNSLVLLGAMVTAGFDRSSFKFDASKNDPVNESHKLLAVVPVATVDRIGLLTDCFIIFLLPPPSISLVITGPTSTIFAFNPLTEVDDFNDASPPLPSSSSVMSSALSIVFCASFNAVLARLAKPVASNQLIVVYKIKNDEKIALRNQNKNSAFSFEMYRFEYVNPIRFFLLDFCSAKYTQLLSHIHT